MAYVPVPKDLSRVKTKVLFNLTKRQLICFSLAGITGIPFYLLTRNAIGSTASASLMILMVLPFFLFAMYEKDGMPLEKVLSYIWRYRFKRPRIRIYQTKNLYAQIEGMQIGKEGNWIDKTARGTDKNKKRT